MNKFQNKKGLTLLELIITLAIFSIVVVATMDFFLYNNRVYNKSVNLSQVQFDIRMASDYITSELRNKNAISTTQSTLPNYINSQTLQEKYPSVKNVDFHITKRDSEYFISFTISGSDEKNNNTYSLESNIMLNNIISTSENSGTIIYYE